MSLYRCYMWWRHVCHLSIQITLTLPCVFGVMRLSGFEYLITPRAPNPYLKYASIVICLWGNSFVQIRICDDAPFVAIMPIFILSSRNIQIFFRKVPVIIYRLNITLSIAELKLIKLNTIWIFKKLNCIGENQCFWLLAAFGANFVSWFKHILFRRNGLGMAYSATMLSPGT